MITVYRDSEQLLSIHDFEGVRGVVLDQFKSLVLEVIFGADYHGIHAFCIFSMKIPFVVWGW